MNMLTTAARVFGIALASLCAASNARSQAAPAEPAAIAFKTVADALASLEGRDGQGTVVTRPEGWVVINEPATASQWSFVPKDHEAYPALVRRTVLRGADQSVSVHVTSLCEAAAAPCAKLVVDFKSMNDRITQSVRARARQGSTQPR
jgi:hypothetical protein